ncbi:CCA-adding enzyme [Actinobacillus succinogenes]|uniref:CCA-adding enzyme n=1 Tax=Actinobacillus succinogenes (strain ATCC 55618 / DSM 22257 / CCUG 43843 / 130Z) TaxID=339671 RepID=CCA_ACTSZ|nr:multifunctional CCA addition/repair protein [Actinobacillus succinogenes]A6VN94.1 RecName: Full=CCA-adding enzyme; AltName: Full=CCA tRNA nucleotidyltransferase; AltName: Full=tRNA CCA-pyrophosphorylase; AltName: Full=tRNA adenylyl-/cytidylyl- transferase; AltName: Full=tRNA nucleotidyltransferase; AltName: Full=tRNA-NT [Actinobacillus succinogenes 130Z]ABR74441.1 Polynucleotide adenylyltransferase region [Actinobacillus succinogenes 130Z]PHI41138.1 CCA-adding enzyme [Actinobacillus succinoge
MNIYLVGGAVRDQLLHLPVKDRDWLVVGSTPDELLSLGYLQVGKDFPVFIHPETHEEYALARTEKKSGSGYTGFICDFSPDITLEDDLIRRDLTINAIAQDKNGKLYDPYHGIEDLNNRLLRHISPSFEEDPLRVLRVARFAAKFYHLGFAIAPETLELMKKLSTQGELQHLTAERVWLETEKALMTENPEIYFQTLLKIDALPALMPELATISVENFQYAMTALKNAVSLIKNMDCNKSAVCFATIFLGIIYVNPSHMTQKQQEQDNHQKNITPCLFEKLKVPAYHKELAILAGKYHIYIHNAFNLKSHTIIDLFNKWDVWRKPQRFLELLIVCAAHYSAQSKNQPTYPQKSYLLGLYQKAMTIDVKNIVSAGFKKTEIRNELTRQRISAVEKIKNCYP